jgi:hypothetical protein
MLTPTFYRTLAELHTSAGTPVPARRASTRPRPQSALAGLPFLGAEAVILLGLDESRIAARSALRKIGGLLRMVEDPPQPRRR